jgi:hypothetical protein
MKAQAISVDSDNPASDADMTYQAMGSGDATNASGAAGATEGLFGELDNSEVASFFSDAN